MKATELRIGNYVTYLGIENICKIDLISEHEIDLDADYTEYLDIGFDDPELKPIPLTEEWLLKFGFEKYIHKVNTKEQYTSDVVFKIDVDKHDTITICLGKMFSMPMLKNKDGQHYYLRGITSVHQLQNLYFALTGQELTIS